MLSFPAVPKRQFSDNSQRFPAACGKRSRGPDRRLQKPAAALDVAVRGEVAEWLKAHAWKVCIRETVSRVRIPLSPPPYAFGYGWQAIRRMV